MPSTTSLESYRSLKAFWLQKRLQNLIINHFWGLYTFTTKCKDWLSTTKNSWTKESFNNARLLGNALQTSLTEAPQKNLQSHTCTNSGYRSFQILPCGLGTRLVCIVCVFVCLCVCVCGGGGGKLASFPGPCFIWLHKGFFVHVAGKVGAWIRGYG